LSDLEPQFEGELPADAVVIRGGEMRVKDLRTSAQQYRERTKGTQGYALTVWCWPGHTAEETAQAVGSRVLPHPVLRKCTVGKLRDVGYPLEKTGPEHHYSLRLPNPPGPQDWRNLRGAFDPPQPNPVAVR
jgi:hypothetical protein